MKLIQKLIALSLMIFLTISLAKAQRGDKNVTPEIRAQKQTERLTKHLSLNESQASKVATINLQYANKMKTAKDNASDKKAGKAAMKNLRTEQSTAIKAVLTPEQLVKYNEKGDRRRGGKKGKRNGKGKHGADKGTPQERAAKHTERMTEDLGLTPDQVKRVSTINLDYAQKKATAKNATADKEACKAACKDLRKEQSEAIKAVLTPEQLVKYNEKGHRKRGGKKGRKSSGEAN